MKLYSTRSIERIKKRDMRRAEAEKVLRMSRGSI
jgi:hypothetical protein